MTRLGLVPSRIAPRRLAAAAMLVASLGPLAWPAAAAPAAARHAADCVAALKAKEPTLAASLKAGADVEPELLRVVRSGVAIIGTQYMAGLHEDEAKALLAAAERDFPALPPASAQARQTQCLQEGEALYQGASSLEQSLVMHAARKRVKRLKAG